MPTYKLCFLDASWQDRKFMSLTRIDDDGTARILHSVLGKQVSFGFYKPGTTRKLEQLLDQTMRGECDVGEDIATEESFRRLLDTDIVATLCKDKEFLELNEQQAISANWEHPIAAARDLKKGICRKMLPVGDTTYQYREYNYREFIVSKYMDYVMSCNDLRVNADPQGLFTEIHAHVQTPEYRHPNAKTCNLKATMSTATAIHQKLTTLLVAAFPPAPVYFEYQFIGQAVPHHGNGLYLEITEPNYTQIQIVDALFDLAAKRGFFPENPQAVIRQAWEAHVEALNFISKSKAGAPTLFSATSTNTGCKVPHNVRDQSPRP